MTATALFVALLALVQNWSHCLQVREETISPFSFECIPGWQAKFGKCYFFVNSTARWKDANKFCKSYGGMLARPHDEVEQVFISKMGKRNFVTKDYFWIGMKMHNGSLYWGEVTPTSISEGFWGSYQPDFTEGDCVAIKDDDGFYYCKDCRNTNPFVCQSTACLKGYFRCSSGTCISSNLTCDGKNDCKDYSDELDCPSKCRKVLKEDSGTLVITSSEYKNNVDCWWTVVVSTKSRIKLQFERVDLEKDADFVTIYSGGTTPKNSDHLGTLSGNVTDLVYYSKNNYFFIRFVSDDKQTFSGFTANWTTDITGLSTTKLIASSVPASLLSPVYPRLLPDLRMYWKIETEKSSLITLQIESLKLNAGNNDYLEISYGSKLNTVAHLTHLPYKEIFISNSNMVFLFLSTDGKAVEGGFNITYQNGCQVNLSGEYGAISSPGYSMVNGSKSQYPNGVTCSWTSKNYLRPVTLNFKDFDLEVTDDVVKIYDGIRKEPASNFTGITLPTPYTAQSGTFSVIFQSSIIVQGKGFHAVYSIDCPKLKDVLSSWVDISSNNPSTEMVGSEVTLSCKLGASFSHEEHQSNSSQVPIRCLQGGAWNVTRLPNCQPTYCGSPVPITNGFIKNATGVFYNSSVTYSCFDGFTRTGAEVVNCSETKTWGSPPSCTEVKCPDISLSGNLRQKNITGSGISFGSILEFSCDEGYDLIGSRRINCLNNKKWSSSVPTCTRLSCPLPEISQATISRNNTVVYEDNITVICNNGFVINESTSNVTTVMCLSNRTFGELPLCVDIDECLTSSPCHANETCINTIGSYRCDCLQGFERQGKDCEDVDECQSLNGGCSDTCVNSVGSYSCSCPSGKVLFTSNGLNNYQIPAGETGLLPGDTLHYNHTCINVKCDSPGPIANGMLLSNRTYFYYLESIKYKCFLGFTTSTQTNLTCQSNGTWSSSRQVCSPVTCPNLNVSEINSTRLLISISPSSAIEFGRNVTMKCKHPKLGEVERILFCAYNRTSTAYELQGDAPECPVVDCGKPDIQGADFTVSPNTTYEASILFECKKPLIRHGKSSLNDFVIRCQKNGLWDFGSLRCLGDRCSDPGTPAEAVQMAKNYEVNAYVSFSCHRTGYKPVPQFPLLCEGNKTEDGKPGWNASLPECIDMTSPEFHNCPTDVLMVEYLAAATVPVLNVTDNSGLVKSVNASGNFHHQQPISRDINVSYTAVDFAGNENVCVIMILVKNEVPPSISCPKYVKATLTNSSSYDINTSSHVNVTGSSSYTTNPVSVTASLNKVGQSVLVTATSGKSASCNFTIVFDVEGCHEEMIGKPQNGEKNCTRDSAGALSCILSCNEGFYFPDSSTSASYVCSGDNHWAPHLPPGDCSSSRRPAYILNFNIVHQIEGFSKNCIDSHTKQVNKSLPEILHNLSRYCNLTHETKPFQITHFASTRKEKNVFQIGTSLIIKFQANLTESTKDSCSSIVKTLVTEPSFKSLFNYTGKCPVTKIIVTVKTANLSCDENEIMLFKGTKQEVCILCSAGMFFNGSHCVQCLAGEYQDEFGKSECKKCPAGTSTAGMGSKKGEDCLKLCSPGFISATNGSFPPCFPCKANTYWSSSGVCSSCSANTSTMNLHGQTKCIKMCSPGNYSTTGHEPCKPCPLGFYQPLVGNSTCIACSSSSATTREPGSVSEADCIDSAQLHCNKSITCKNSGRCEAPNRVAECQCSPGYTGSTCESKINPCESQPCFNGAECKLSLSGLSFTCVCPSFTKYWLHPEIQSLAEEGSYHTISGKNSEHCKQHCLNDTHCVLLTVNRQMCLFYNYTKLTTNSENFKSYSKQNETTLRYNGSRCELETEQYLSCNDTVCGTQGMCQELIDGFRCLCPSSGVFTGDRCEEVSNLCAQGTCKNNGNCTAFESVRYQCACPHGFTGKNCETDIDECALKPSMCLYDGKCSNNSRPYSCDCLPQFSGKHCETVGNFCSNATCANGLCYNDYDAMNYTCICDSPYMKDPSGSCKEIDFCQNQPCLRNGTCTSTHEGFSCQCPNGYNGIRCQHNIDDCVSSPCQHGTCSDKLNGYNCTCKKGFTGTNCDTNEDDCFYTNKTHKNCISNQSVNCTDLVNDYQCFCLPGYTGRNCENEIDECGSQPCSHNASCIDLVNDFSCKCTTGWSGKTCDASVDYCASKPCQNDGSCYSLQEDFFCKCAANAWGRRCDITSSLCSVVEMCAHNGLCNEAEQLVNCSCDTKYFGKYCQYIKDPCKSNPCLHGAECSISKTANFSCSCSKGYSGAKCEYRVDPCSVMECGTAKCIAIGDSAFCNCPQSSLYLGGACRNVSSNFDLFFDSDISMDGSRLIHPLKLSSSGLSLTFWVRFVKEHTTGTLVTFDINGYGKEQILQITEKTVTVSNGNHSVQAEYTTKANINNREWHHIGVTWTASGQLIVYLDLFTEYNKSVGVSPKNNTIYITLGKAFHGYITQMWIWNKVLNRIQVISAKRNSSYVPPTGVVQTWGGYQVSKGVTKQSPSQLEHPSPARSDESAPTFDTCDKSDQFFLSKNRFMRLTSLVKPTSSADIQSSVNTDGEYTWGALPAIFIVKNSNDYYTECQSKVYVQYNSCPYLSHTRDVSLSLNRSGIFSYNCPAGKALCQKFPRMLRCGKLGVFDQDNPFEPFVLPSCGETADPKKDVEIKFNYTFVTTCQDKLKDRMQIEIFLLLDKLAKDWKELCIISNSSHKCSNAFLTLMCVPGKNIANAVLSIKQTSAFLYRKSDQKELTVKQLFKDLILRRKLFNFPAAAGASVRDDTVDIQMSTSCTQGFAFVNNVCVACGPGTYYNSSTETCVFCPIGFFQSSLKRAKCDSCPSGKVTPFIGSADSSDCFDPCMPGEFYNITQQKCHPCRLGYYQDKRWKTYCNPCPLGRTTLKEGSNSSSHCSDDCSSGTELMLDGCKNCSRGFYRMQHLQVTCTPCPAGNTTLSVGSISITNCSIPACLKGQYLEESSMSCRLCERGYYQPNIWQFRCHKCPANYSTYEEGATDESRCKKYCQSGYELVSNDSDTCQLCKLGFYRTLNLNDTFASCIKCPENYTTTMNGSTSNVSCAQKICTAGQVMNVSLSACSDCPLDTYQPVNNPSPDAQCTKCPKGTGTISKRTSHRSKCYLICQVGEFYHQQKKKCEQCAVGMWNNGNLTLRLQPCVKCPSGFVTASKGATSDANCTVVDCEPGTYLVNSQCLSCPIGQYQPLRAQSRCMECGPQKNTSDVGSVSEANCTNRCPAGKEGQTVCTACKLGYFKNYEGHGQCAPCSTNYTSDSTRTSCSVLHCSKGFYSIKNSECKACDLGYYKDKPGNFPCTRCPDLEYTTHSMATTNRSHCNLRICPPGSELNITDNCNPCPLGFYKSYTGGEKNCTACPYNTITLDIGSVSASNCSIADCTAGSFRSAGPGCSKCYEGYYQPEGGKSSCIRCPQSTTTYQQGSQKENECLLKCIPGKEYDFKTKQCRSCRIGFYKEGDKGFCLACPLNYTTYTNSSSAKSDCQPFSGQGDVSEDITGSLIFNFKYSVSGCNSEANHQFFKDIILKIVISNLQKLSKIWKGLCSKNCTGIKIMSFNCPNVGKRRKRQISILDITLALPNVSAKVTNEANGKVQDVSSIINVDCLRQNNYNLSQYKIQSVGSCTASFDCMCNPGSLKRNSPCECVYCQAGTYHDVQKGSCEKCPVGMYQNAKGKVTCIQCAEKLTTLGEGSLTRSSCREKCKLHENYCQNDGKCQLDSDGHYTCHCKVNYHGEQCQTLSRIAGTEKRSIIIAVVAVLGFLLIIILLVTGAVMHLRSKGKSKKKLLDPNIENFRNPIYDTGSKFAMGPQPLWADYSDAGMEGDMATFYVPDNY